MGVGRSGGVGKGKGRCFSCSMTGTGGSYWHSEGGAKDAQPSIELTQPKYCSLPMVASLWDDPQVLPSPYPHPCVMPSHFVPGWQHVTRVMRSLLRLLLFWFGFCSSGSSLCHVGSSSLTRDQTWIPCIETITS